jgi:hypothetical protein
MAGIYAHFVIAELASYSKILEEEGFTELKSSLLEYSNFVLLGANSPDLPYPYKDDLWGNHMHYDKTGALLSNAIALLKKMTGPKFLKCRAWLMGYASHLVADTVIHPMVNKICISYNIDPAPHQLCEKHQDAYAFHKLKIGETTQVEYVSSTIANCSNSGGELDDDINEFWTQILLKTFPESGIPQPSKWFKRYVFLADKFGEEGSWFHIRALATALGKEQLLQIEYAKIERNTYIDNLKTQSGFNSYEEIIDKAVVNTSKAWIALSNVLCDKPTNFPIFSHWNLDTGRDETGNLLFWVEEENLSEAVKPETSTNTGLPSWLKTAIATFFAFAMMIFSGFHSNLDPTIKHKVQIVSKHLYSQDLLKPLPIMGNTELQNFIKSKKPEWTSDFSEFYLEFTRQKVGFFQVYESNAKKVMYFNDDITTLEVEETPQ